MCINDCTFDARFDINEMNQENEKRLAGAGAGAGVV
jgi:hypothetical protein